MIALDLETKFQRITAKLCKVLKDMALWLQQNHTLFDSYLRMHKFELCKATMQYLLHWNCHLFNMQRMVKRKGYDYKIGPLNPG